MSTMNTYDAIVKGCIEAAKEGRTKEALTELQATYDRAVVDGDDGALAQICEAIGIVHFERGSYRDALVWLNRALAIASELGIQRTLATVTANIGRVHHMRGAVDEAIDAYERSRGALRELGELYGVATTDVNLAMLYESRGEFPQALESYYRALETFERNGSWFGVAHICDGLAEFYLDTGDSETAATWARKARDLYQENGSLRGVSVSTAVLARSLRKQGDVVGAISLLRESIDRSKDEGLRRETGLSLRLLAEALIETGELEEAERLLDEAEEITRSLEITSEYVSLAIARAEISSLRGERDAAVASLEEALPVATSIGLNNQLREIVEGLHSNLRDTDPVRALHHLEAAYALKERILGEQKQRRVAMLEMEHQISQERREHERQIAEERALRKQQRELLINVMPPSVADRLIAGETRIADAFDDATVLFLDLVEFTRLSSGISAQQVVHLLNAIFREIDHVVHSEGLTKIKTIGDAYLVVGGVPEPLADHVTRTANAAVRIQQVLKGLTVSLPKELGTVDWSKIPSDLTVRMGLHVGPLTAGVIGEHRIAYDVWGDTVNVASRMEQTSEPGRIQVSATMAERLRDVEGLSLEERGVVEVKGKGAMATYWLAAHS